MKNYGAKDVDAYITGAPKEARPTLHAVRALIRSAAPKAAESISWGIPFYKYQGLLAGFAAQKHHVSFGLVTVLQDTDRALLEKKGYGTGKKTVQIRFDQQVPAAVLRRIIRAQAKLNESRMQKKK